MSNRSTLTRAQRHRNISQAARSQTVDWLEELGTKFVDVTLLARKPSGTEILVEQHVDDLTTLPETIRMSMERLRADYAIYPYMGRWCLVSQFKERAKMLRYYDSKEAAEMVALHNG